MKKHISILLIVSLILSSITTGTAADLESSASIYQDNPVPLEIIGEDEEKIFNTADYPVPESCIVNKLNDVDINMVQPAQEYEAQTQSSGFNENLFTQFNTVTAPTVANGAKEPKFSYEQFIEENISEYSGELTLNFEDLVLDGLNDFDLRIGRTYQSVAADNGDYSLIVYPYSDTNGIRLNNEMVQKNSSYLMDRYNLGVGWGFSFPSVELATEYIPVEIGNTYYYEEKTEIYYHSGNGEVYKVEFTEDTGDSNLKYYYKKDICFNKEDTAFSNGQVTSYYSMTLTDRSKQYFASDGRLLGMVDSFGNTIRFEHDMMSVSNKVPDGYFMFSAEYDSDTSTYKNVNTWIYSSSSGGESDVEMTMERGKSDYSSAHFIQNNDLTNSYIMTRPIQVEPNRTYDFGMSVLAAHDSGDINIEIVKYDTAYNVRDTEILTLSDHGREIWHDYTASVNVSTAVRYVVIKISSADVGGAFHSIDSVTGTYIDNVYLNEPKPVISKITDTVGRTVEFEYTGDMFNSEPETGSVTLTVTSPDGNTKELIYNKELIEFPGVYLGGLEHHMHWYLKSSVTDGNNAFPVYYTYNGGVGEDGYLPVLRRSYEYKYTISSDPQSFKPLLSTIQYKDRAKIYEYEAVRKNLGEDGYYDTFRISKKYDSRLTATENEDGETEQEYVDSINEINYSYIGSYEGDTFDNETGFPDYYIDSDITNTAFCKTTKTGKKTEIVSFNNNMVVKRTSSDGNILIQSDYTNHADYKTPVLIENTVSQGDDFRKTYLMYSYNNWGGLQSETKEIDDNIRTDADLLSKYTTTYEYEPNYHFVTQKSYYTDSNGPLVSEKNIYNDNGTLLSSTDAVGKITEYSYDINEAPWAVTKQKTDDPMGFFGVLGNNREITYDYDIYNLYPVSVTEEYKGGTSTRRYKHDYITGNILQENYPDGGFTKYSYYTDGRIYAVIHPYSISGYSQYFNTVDIYEYTDLTLVEGVVVPPLVCTSEKITRYIQYDDDGTLNPYNIEYNYYDAAGNLKVNSKYISNNQYADSIYFHDSYDRLIKSVDCQGNTAEYTYDAFDRPLTVTDSESNKYIYCYSDVAKSVDLTFDGHTETDSRHVISQKYDNRGNITERTVHPAEGEAFSESFSYDLSGNLVSYTDPNGNITQYKYDAKSRLRESVLPNGQKITSNYSSFDKPTFEKIFDTNGNEKLSRVSYRNEKGDLNMKFYQYDKVLGQSNTYVTDSKGRAAEIKEGEYTKTFIYDELDNVLQSTGGNQVMQFLYNPYGISKYESFVDNQLDRYDQYGYNILGDISKKVHNGDFTTSYSYSANNRLLSAVMPSERTENYTYTPNGNLNSIATDSKDFTYEYYDTGFIKSINYPNGLKTVYEYDNINHVRSIVTALGDTVINTFAYTYDGNGNTLAETRNGETTAYTYDSLDRLTSVTYSDGSTVSYEYDGFNNRTREIYSNGDVKEYVYNGQYQLTEVKLNGTTTDTYAYNKSGAIVSHNDKSYTYDSFDRLTGYTDGTNTHTYTYDVNGIRVAKNDKQYVVDINNNVIAEADADSAITDEIIWGHQPLARKSGDSWYYYIYNAHGDVVGMADSTGNIVNTYEYDPWGNILSQTEAVDNPIKYAGEYYDDELGMYYLRARYYDPTVGRFISRDIKEGDISSPLDMNRYVYCRNNPVKYVDPSGEGPVAATFGQNTQWLANADAQLPVGDIIYVGAIVVGAVIDGIVYLAKKSKSTDKEKANDIPSWAKGQKPKEGESGSDYAKRLCDEKYGSGNYKTGPGSEYNQLKKYGDRGAK